MTSNGCLHYDETNKKPSIDCLPMMQTPPWYAPANALPSASTSSRQDTASPASTSSRQHDIRTRTPSVGGVSTKLPAVEEPAGDPLEYRLGSSRAQPKEGSYQDRGRVGDQGTPGAARTLRGEEGKLFFLGGGGFFLSLFLFQTLGG